MISKGDMVWVKTTEYSASRAIVLDYHEDGYYVRFMDKTLDQNENHRYPVLKKQVCPLDYIGWEK
jgi:hypothetical protein